MRDSWYKDILFIKLDKCFGSQADIQIRVNLLIQAPMYTIGGSLLYGIILIQTTK